MDWDHLVEDSILFMVFTTRNMTISPNGMLYIYEYIYYNYSYLQSYISFMAMLDWHIFNESHMMEDPEVDPEIHLGQGGRGTAGS